MKNIPNWYSNGIIYQIFVDSFFHSDDSANEKLKRGLLYSDSVSMEWEEKRNPKHHSNAFYGGDLEGIIQKLDYIKDFGANIIYITPIMMSESNHRYNITDYRAIDPSLGDMNTFHQLINEIHRRDMKIIIDLVFSHCSNRHQWFKKALNDPHSHHRKKFHFAGSTDSYYCWRNVRSVPMWNLNHPEVIEELITGEEGVLKFWIRQGIDGIRLDCANDLSPEITRLITDTTHQMDPEIPVIGEVFSYPSGWKEACTGVQSYYVTASIMSLINQKIKPAQFGKNVSHFIDDMGWEKIRSSLCMIASHDIPRAITELGEDIKKMRLAIILLFTLPGIPLIYYGEEIGMSGGEDPMNRHAMLWNEDQWNKEILKHYRDMITIRKNRKELTEGYFYDLSEWINGEVAAFYRATDKPGEFSLVVINPTDKQQKLRLFIPYPWFFDAMTIVDSFTGNISVNRKGYFDLEIESKQAAIFTPQPDAIINYHFYHRLGSRYNST